MPQHNKRGQHTTLGREEKRNIEKLDADPRIKKVILGIAKGCTHNHKVGSLRVQRLDEARNTIYIAAYSSKGIMNVSVICREAKDIHPVADFIKSLAH